MNDCDLRERIKLQLLEKCSFATVVTTKNTTRTRAICTRIFISQIYYGIWKMITLFGVGDDEEDGTRRV